MDSILSDILAGYVFHLVKPLVFTTPGPAEHAGVRSAAGMNRPHRRDRGLFIRDCNMAGFITRSHEVKHFRIIVQVVIHVDRCAALIVALLR